MRPHLLAALLFAGCPTVTDPVLDDDDVAIGDDDAADDDDAVDDDDAGDDDDVGDDDDATVRDTDGDGVVDAEDRCEGGDDNLDFDGDGTPAWCDPTPEQVGAGADLGGTREIAVNFLMGTRSTLSEEGSLQSVGVIGRRVGPAFRVAIYADDAGEPTTLVADVQGGDLPNGPVSVPVPELVLPAGDYWICVVFQNDARVGDDGAEDVTTRWFEQDFAAPLPQTWPELAFSFPGSHLNLWMDVGR